jgi:hypothetical protein
VNEGYSAEASHLRQSPQEKWAAARPLPASGRTGRIAILSPQAEGGVTDYSALIAQRLGAVHARFAEGRVQGWPTRSGEPEAIVIQFSGYGFHRRGVPFDLLRWIRQRKAEGTRVGVFFHELFASGPPWRSSFWLSPLQRYIATELARLADFWLTNRRASAEWLLRRAGEKPNAVLPTPSNVGELTSLAAQRNRSVVVFGSPAVRLQTYKLGGRSLLDWAAGEGLTVYDIGPSLQDQEWRLRLEQRGVAILGRLSAPQVSDLLAKATFGAVAYPLAYIAKSGVFAAYCAHGVCPIVYSDHYPEADGLVAGRHYLAPQQLGGASSQGPSCARQAHLWYRSHGVDQHAEAMRTLLVR